MIGGKSTWQPMDILLLPPLPIGLKYWHLWAICLLWWKNVKKGEVEILHWIEELHAFYSGKFHNWFCHVLVLEVQGYYISYFNNKKLVVLLSQLSTLQLSLRLLVSNFFFFNNFFLHTSSFLCYLFKLKFSFELVFF